MHSIDEAIMGCGFDAEQIDRFDKISHEGHPFPFVFSHREICHSSLCIYPAKALCAAFCTKEAFYKAVGGDCFNFTECEFFFTGLPSPSEITLSASLRDQFSITRAVVQITEFVVGELTAIVYLLGKTL